MQPPTLPCRGLLQAGSQPASSLSRPNPFPPPSRHAAAPRGGSLSTTRRNFRFFRGQPSQPPLPHFFALFADTSRADPRSTLSYRSPSEHAYSPPLAGYRCSHRERQQRDGPRGFLQDRGGGRRKQGWPYIYCCHFFSTLSGASIFDDSHTGVPSWSRVDLTRVDKITFAAFLSELNPARPRDPYFHRAPRLIAFSSARSDARPMREIRVRNGTSTDETRCVASVACLLRVTTRQEQYRILAAAMFSIGRNAPSVSAPKRYRRDSRDLKQERGKFRYAMPRIVQDECMMNFTKLDNDRYITAR